MNESDERFVAAMRDRLRGSEALDPQIERRLGQIRRQALAESASRHRVPAKAWFAGGLATAFALVLAVGVWLQAPMETTPRDSLAEAVDVVVMGDRLDLYEDLDFYVWLARQDVGS